MPIRRPALWLSLTEPLRAAIDCLTLLARWPQLAAAPRGDGHTVLVLPGFGTSDLSTAALRAYLSWLGYRSEPWRLGYNTGYRKLGVGEDALRRRLVRLSLTSRGKISLIGWSMGGVMARHLARDEPDLVRAVITLGAPFTGDPTAISIRPFYELVSGETIDSAQARARFERNRTAPEMPTTAIYSRNDGITAWENCLEDTASHLNNVHVRGSHVGLTHNPEVLVAVAIALAASSSQGSDLA